MTTKRKRFIKDPVRLLFKKKGISLQTDFYFGKHEGYKVEIEPKLLQYWVFNDALRIVREGKGEDLNELKKKAKDDLKGLGVKFLHESRKK